ncbi:hypothetical protein PCE1_000652 [Barthelona sp. PCE]
MSYQYIESQNVEDIPLSSAKIAKKFNYKKKIVDRAQILSIAYKNTKQLKRHKCAVCCFLALPILYFMLMLTLSGQDPHLSMRDFSNATIDSYPGSTPRKGFYTYKDGLEYEFGNYTKYLNHGLWTKIPFDEMATNLTVHDFDDTSRGFVAISEANDEKVDLIVMKSPYQFYGSYFKESPVKMVKAIMKGVFERVQDIKLKNILDGQLFARDSYEIMNSTMLFLYISILSYGLHMLFVQNTFTIRNDYKTKMLELLRLSGLKSGSYFVANVIVFTIVQFIVYTLFVLYAYYSKIRPFNINVVFWIISILASSICLSALSVLVGVMFKKGSVVFAIMYGFGVPSFVANYVQQGGISKIWYGLHYKFKLFWLPSYNIIHVFTHGVYNSAFESNTMGWKFLLQGNFWYPIAGCIIDAGICWGLVHLFLTNGWRDFAEKWNPVSVWKRSTKSINSSLLTPLVVTRSELEAQANPDIIKEVHEAETNSNAKFRVSHIRKVFNPYDADPKVAVDDVSFVVDGVVALVGPSGAGKTTLINSVLNLHPRTRGKVFFKDVEITQQNEAFFRTRVGLLPQDNANYEDLTVEETLYMFAILKSVDGASRASFVEAALRVCSLLNERYKLASALSGGLQRCLMLAISLVSGPDVLLLDEPLSSISIDLKDKIREIVRLQSRRCAIVISSHCLSDIELLADKCVILADGNVRAVGQISDLKKKYNKGMKLEIAVKDDVDESVIMHHLNPILADFSSFLVDRANSVFVWRVDITHKQLAVLFGLVRDCVEEGPLKDYIRYWNMSPSTLEDVFLTVTRDIDTQL